MGTEFVTVSEAASILKCHEKSIYRRWRYLGFTKIKGVGLRASRTTIESIVPATSKAQPRSAS
jgi:hypothetical protein